MSSRHATQEDENSFGSQGKEHSGLGFLKKAEKKKNVVIAAVFIGDNCVTCLNVKFD